MAAAPAGAASEKSADVDGGRRSRAGSFRYCAMQVERLDADRYATTLFAPPQRRAALHALYAFNLEIARTRERITQPVIGQMRLQWWRDAIEGIYAGTPRHHEVVLALDDLVGRFDLDRSLFERLIDAREADLEDTPPATLAALTEYAEATSAPLTMLALRVLGVRGEAPDQAARDVGIAWALVGLIRAIPFHAAARRRTLPDDVLAQAGASSRDLLELRPHAGLNKAVARVAQAASQHLARARKRRNVPKQALPALLPARLADGYLRLAGKCDYDPFDDRLAGPLPSRALRLIVANLRGTF